MKWFYPSPHLDVPQIGFSNMNRISDLLRPKTQEASQNGQHVRGFQARTPICQTVPTSRAHAPTTPPLRNAFSKSCTSVFQNLSRKMPSEYPVPLSTFLPKKNMAEKLPFEGYHVTSGYRNCTIGYRGLLSLSMDASIL